MIKKTLIFVMIQIVCLGAYAAKPVPYLQTPTDNSIWVNWRTNNGTETQVFFGESENVLNFMVTGSHQTISSTKNDNFGYNYHSAKLTGLKPDTRYYYQVVSGSDKSDVYSFKTQPTIGKEGIYRFLILGDHQLDDDRYERLMKAAKETAETKYNKPIEDCINLITNVGDQVNDGSPYQYYNIHFKRSELLSPNLPIMTIVGNHELYEGAENPLQFYNDHFIYGNIEYQGIKSNSEFYYAMQQGRALFLMLSSDHPGTTQYKWAKAVIEKAKEDDSVDWIFSYNHRPLQAEQYVGDVSVWVRDEIMPLLNTTEKSVMNVAGHHHLYHRGQLRDYPTYHIISGGAAWNQQWGSSQGEGYIEQDFDDVQKTIAYWPFQIVELNSDTKTMTVETYIIGNENETLKETKLVDTFSRTFGKKKPGKPSITNAPTTDVTLPYTFESSAYSKTDYDYNSVQFQIASDNQFANLEFDLIRDYENIYGDHEKGAIFPDLNKEVNIFKQAITKDDIYNGTHYIRVRHRDRNLEWSDWSDVKTFKTVGGNDVTVPPATPAISANKDKYTVGEQIEFTYSLASGNNGQWIGVYREAKKYPGDQSIAWKEMSGTEGTISIETAASADNQKYVIPGAYYAVVFKDGGYVELARTGLFYVGLEPSLSLEKTVFDLGEDIKVSFSNAPKLDKDWIGIYREGQTPGRGAGTSGATHWTYISTTNGTDHTFTQLSEGDYFITYLMQEEYYEPTDRIYFQVISKEAPEDPASSTPEPMAIDSIDGASLVIAQDMANDRLTISYPIDQPVQAVLCSISGTVVKSFFFENTTTLSTDKLDAGAYLLHIADKVEKILIP